MAAARISTCLWFDSDAEAAALLYCSLFADARITSVFRQSGDPQNRVFLIEFSLNGQNFAAMNGGPMYRLSPATLIVVQLGTQDEVDRIWPALVADSGQQSRGGWLTDRYGLSWQIIPRALPRLLQADASGRVLQAMMALMAMVKIDIAALELAFKG